MKALVIYDTTFGNTKKIAEAISETLVAASIAVSEVRADELPSYDLIVVGSPILGWKPSEKTIAFLGSLRAGQLEKVKAAAFDTRVKMFIHGDAAGKISKALAAAGAQMVTGPQAFHVKGKEGPLFEGEIENAKSWAELIKKKAGPV